MILYEGRMYQMFRSLYLGQSFCVLACVAIIGGCGGVGDQPDIGTVAGTVTLDGKPLADAEIIFQHENKRFSHAATDANGQYELTYIRDIKGAAVGKHRVVIKARDARRRQIVPLKYNANTTLTAEVKPGQNTFDFALTSGR